MERQVKTLSVSLRIYLVQTKQQSRTTKNGEKKNELLSLERQTEEKKIDTFCDYGIMRSPLLALREWLSIITNLNYKNSAMTVTHKAALHIPTRLLCGTRILVLSCAIQTDSAVKQGQRSFSVHFSVVELNVRSKPRPKILYMRMNDDDDNNHFYYTCTL